MELEFLNMKKKLTIFCYLLCIGFLYAQTDSLKVKINKLDEIILNSSRIDLPFSEYSRNINVITASDIKKSGASDIITLLQQISGIDIRQRGIEGTQADLYIRGGSFDQTLLLVDGIKLEDAQTGHHTLNLLPPINLIDRIEILKGPAARIYGQNAFTGAINIVMKNIADTSQKVSVRLGSFEQFQLQSTLKGVRKNIGLLGHYSYNESRGYRYNTDFINRNYFIKGNINNSIIPIQFIGFFSERNFGANGFYATPEAKNQYEETQGSLVAITSIIKNDKSILKPKIYWRRNQDMYVYLRNNPSVYRNLHIGNKVGVALDYSLFSNNGTTGLGIDFARVGITSNNLGNHHRTMVNIFAEHRFLLWNEFDITPGVAINNYTDFGTRLFPGIDLGYRLTEGLRIYGNTGSTYRIPTYTDLYYSDRTTLGNKNLKPENATAVEIGFRYDRKKLFFSAAYFNRNAKNLIDYVKNNEIDLWQANNIQKVLTNGFEIDIRFSGRLNKQDQSLRLGYTYLNDKVDGAQKFNFSRYSINSLKHHFTLQSFNKWSDKISSSIIFKKAQRSKGDNPYTVVDVTVQWAKNKYFSMVLRLNNILNESYTEANLVPMPKGNGSLGLQYSF
jgi:vitamin B12 transporter